MIWRTLFLDIVLFLATVLLIGCQQATQTAPPPSPTPLPSDTPQPTATFTPTPKPTDTPTPEPTPPPPITFSFSGTETAGWILSPGKVSNPGEGGNTKDEIDGYLAARAPGDDLISYYVAPSDFHGDWSAYSELSIDLWSLGGPYITPDRTERGDVFLANGDMTAHYPLPYRPPEEWETFVIPLTDNDQWTLAGGVTSLADLLSNVTDLQIRAEYGGGGKPDSSGLDNLVLR
jgi:hypothetical protein